MQPRLELESDILQPIPTEEWPLLKSLLKSDWPVNSNYYYWVKNSIKWKKQEPSLALQIYCPNGEYKDDLTFVGISNYGMSNVVIFSKDKTGKRLYNALVKSKRFDWRKNVTFTGVDERLWPVVKSALAVLEKSSGIRVEHLSCCFFIKSANDCANEEIHVPEECYLADLKPTHLPEINSVWPHGDKENAEDSLNFLRPSVTLNKSIGLFLKQGDILVSWALHYEWGIGSVQTVEVYKRKGYAKIVVNALAKRLGENGISPVLSVVRGNAPAEKMYASLNWKPLRLVRWIRTKQTDLT